MAFTFSHCTLRGYLLRRSCELLSTLKLLLHPTKHDILHSKHISVEVIDQKDKLGVTLKEQPPKKTPAANISTPWAVQLMHREGKWPSRHTWKKHVFILPTVFKSAVETRCTVYRLVGLLYSLRVFFQNLCSFIALKFTHEHNFSSQKIRY